MSFNKMIKGMIEDGLIDQDHNLTPKGHQRAEEIKKEYAAKTGEANQKMKAKEKIEWPMKWT